MSAGVPRRKRQFDLAVVLSSAVLWFTVLVVCALTIWIVDGRPVIYSSRRRVYQNQSVAVPKFRTMRRDAEKIANRDTVPCTKTRFLNIPFDSPLYTRVGRSIERLMLTELPQLREVIYGNMSLVGNRPLPENVIAALESEFGDISDRFSVAAGLTGPVQLVGRDNLSDLERLRIEAQYCQIVASHYSIWLDVSILYHTVVCGVFHGQRFTPEQVFSLLDRYGGQRSVRAIEQRVPVTRTRRIA